MWSDSLVLACTVCFGAADGPMLGAARVGVLVMVCVTCGVLAGLAVLFFRIAKKGDSHHFSQEKGTPS